MTISDTELRAYFDDLAGKRGVENWFDRFEQDSTVSDGIHIHLDVIEVDRGRPTVVFMPGTNAYALLYGEFLAALAGRGYNIVGFDPRGHGRSGGDRGSYTIPELVSDMASAVSYARERFGDPVVVAGSSQGGITAFYFCAAGGPAAGAICHNAADLSDPDSVRLTRNPSFSRMMKPAVIFFARILPELRIPITIYLDLKSEQIRNLGNSRDLLYQDPLAVPYIRLRGMASLAGEKPRRPIEEIKTPILIVHGGRDSIFPRDYIEGIYNRLTCRKSLKVYPGFAHYLMFDHIDAILPDVTGWIEEVCR